MINLIIGIISLSVSIFIFLGIFDLILFIYKKIKGHIVDLWKPEKKKSDSEKKDDVGECGSEISPACLKCAYRSRCWLDFGIEVVDNEKENGSSEDS